MPKDYWSFEADNEYYIGRDRCPPRRWIWRLSLGESRLQNFPFGETFTISHEFGFLQIRFFPRVLISTICHDRRESKQRQI
jgi:hypothetical protein